MPTFTNAGVLNSQSGFLNISGALTNTAGGTVTGPGGFSGNFAFAGGTLAPGLTLGNITFANGTFAVTGPTALAIDLGAAVSDEVIFQNPTGAVNIGASLLTLNVTLSSAPTLNTTFYLLHISSGGAGISGTFVGLPTTGDTLVAPYASARRIPFTSITCPTDITLVYGVPEPSTRALLGAGLTAASAAAPPPGVGAQSCPFGTLRSLSQVEGLRPSRSGARGKAQQVCAPANSLTRIK